MLLYMDRKTKAWLSVSLFGLLIVAVQLLLPDPVPDAINKLLAKNYSHFVGLEFTLKAFLFLWVIGGYVVFLGGVVGAFLSYRRR